MSELAVLSSLATKTSLLPAWLGSYTPGVVGKLGEYAQPVTTAFCDASRVMPMMRSSYPPPKYVLPRRAAGLSAGTGPGAVASIEERSPEEMTHAGGVRLAPEGVDVYNPAFDVTPADLISAIITEMGVFRAPYTESLRSARESSSGPGARG